VGDALPELRLVLRAEARGVGPAVVCQKHRCFLWRTYQQRYNHAPPEWMRLKWEAQYAEAPRKARMQSSIVESVEVAA
jgi:hypothetical protein